MTHYFNEYFDYETDLANKQRGKWNGGSGVLPEGLLPPWVALTAGNVFLIGSVVTLAFLRTPAQYVACATVFLSWLYTGPPFKLHYRGLGEVVVAVVLTWCVPVMGALQRRGDGAFVLPTSLRAIIPLLFVQQFVRMMVMNLPDIESDLQCSKITLTAQMGPERVARLYKFVQHATGMVAVGLFASGHMTWPVLVAFLVAATKGISLARRLDEIVFPAGTRTDARKKKGDDACTTTAAKHGDPLAHTSYGAKGDGARDLQIGSIRTNSATRAHKQAVDNLEKSEAEKDKHSTLTRWQITDSSTRHIIRLLHIALFVCMAGAPIAMFVPLCWFLAKERLPDLPPSGGYGSYYTQ
ncbi:unnamed protein product [Closterium sp. Naga37s-1]|nr:unnamed protein product [Closterium sp. Naga37s-1]